MNQLQRVATTAMLMLTVMASADETIAPVPQGSRAFPTLGQVNCMEEAGSGRLCAATYECQDGWYEGVLWGDMAFHNGRRSLGPDSPIARQRDCTITVDGKASVQWFAGFTPDGPDSAAVGVTDRGEARTPLLRREITTLGGSTEGGTLLEWLYENHDVHPDDIVNEKCGGSWDDDTNGHGDPCWFDALRELGYLLSAEANPLTQCSAELTKEYEELGTNYYSPHRFLLSDMPDFAMKHRCDWDSLWRGGISPTLEGLNRERAVECCRIFEAEADRLGLLPPN